MWRAMEGQEKIVTSLKWNDSVAAALGMLGTILALADWEIGFNETSTHVRYASSSTSTGLRAVISVSTIALRKTSSF